MVDIWVQKPACKARFDEGSKFTQHSTLNASPWSIYTTQTRTLVIPPPPLVVKTHCGEDARSGRQLAGRLCDEPLTRWNQSGISERNRTRSCTACGFLNVTFRFLPEKEMETREGGVNTSICKNMQTMNHRATEFCQFY